MPSSSKFEGQQAPISLEIACSALRELRELWSPRVVGQVNNQYIKVAKVQGEFPWHSHEDEDEMFLVLRGVLRIGRAEADGGPVSVNAGEYAAYGLGTDSDDSIDCGTAGLRVAASKGEIICA